MSETIYVFTLLVPCVTLLLIFGMRALSAARQAKLRFENDEQYRAIAEKAVAAQAASAQALATINASLAEMKAQLATVQAILQQVD